MTIVPTLLDLLELMLQTTVTPKAPCTKSMTKAVLPTGRDKVIQTLRPNAKQYQLGEQDQVQIDSRSTATCMSRAARLGPAVHQHIQRSKLRP
ncbi:uncharacterized protein PHALS_10745 [Plasmopara halstedii]|uniref:RxLR-like protein n=1 Tax=Plasmopara halstedii TaxID=4781 RepID=A0A0N7L558_PLAHL|nr:uncharacterized protein PHALS_10745 [Plasmopara halstedii]CEG40555.1 hypothetical protein PHALS_10745 [Plasmopara halstedii]|eukprot:XP_024576924.1 hypothetical protein PHALS_10745 [Plasmopara halstedii]